MNLKRNAFFETQRAYLPPLLFLVLFSLCGVLLGQVYANRIPESVVIEIRQYLQNYISLDNASKSSDVFVSTLCGYFRYPMISYLLGFSSIGVLLLPILAFVFGFLLSFSISCFMVTYGTAGIALSFAVIGIRCFVTLPCFLALSSYAFRRSACLAGSIFGKGRRTVKFQPDPCHFKHLLLLSLFLLIGVFLDILFVPQFLQLVLERVLI